MRYKIYIIKQEKNAMFQKYPALKTMLSCLTDTNSFYNQQIDLLLENTTDFNSFFYSNFYQRDDYKKIHNHHQLENQLTNEISKCIVHEYCLEIESCQKTNSFIELICHKTQNYVIIS
ncbi:hypothetical protein [Tannockella kyphosi]|uniref:hypothetical protein n=1 Tax=Tannockella kyphosi TaxID=2899121 RepID=UPI002013758F|nr:hypothetical protein [Tannockella kyphosi]